MVFWDQAIIQIYSLLTLFGSIVFVVYVIDFIVGKITGDMLLSSIWSYFGKTATAFTFIIALAATAGSLIFSEILNFAPCQLCWFQRIFMYPQVLLAGLALFKKQGRTLLPYLALLALVGAAIAGFHYYGQVNENTTLPCSAIGYSSSCSDSFFMEFGYITIPMMAFVAFLLILALWHIDFTQKKERNTKKQQ